MEVQGWDVMREAFSDVADGELELWQVYDLLDEAWGPGGWSCSLTVAAVRPAAVSCLLELGGARRSGVGEGPDLDSAAARAILMALEQAGVRTKPAEPPAAPASEAKPSAQELIDKLVARLREAGRGREAAELVVKYGGYGGDPETTRKLYGELRALLLEKGAAR
ncbi:hypothetical protein [Oceanithermus sp.]